MPLPKLLHKTTVLIEQIDRSSTHWDEDAREAVQRTGRKQQVELVAQVRWPRSVSAVPTVAGRTEDGRGYLLFREVDLEAKSVVLQEGDKIVRIGKKYTDMYLEEFEPLGHYQDQGGNTLLKAYFVDRKPSRVANSWPA